MTYTIKAKVKLPKKGIAEKIMNKIIWGKEVGLHVPVEVDEEQVIKAIKKGTIGKKLKVIIH